jgi:NADPH:quinone reductase-like Zn-dependent oxidoreductase
MLNVRTEPKALTHIGQWLAEGKIKVVKDRVYSYHEAQAAFAQLRAGHVRGKVVIEGPTDE